MTLKQHLHDLKGNPLGMAILAVGVLSFLVVISLAYKTFTGGDANNAGVSAISKEEIQSFRQTEIVEKSAASSQLQNQPQKKKNYKRQKSISESDIAGAWDARLDEARALLQIKGGTYRLILVMDNPAESRLYSNGTYTLKDDLLVLKPNMAWGPPKSSQFNYRVLTRADMPVMVSLYKGKLVWQIPSDDMDIYVPNYHPVLSLVKDKIAVWGVLK